MPAQLSGGTLTVNVANMQKAEQQSAGLFMSLTQLKSANRLMHQPQMSSMSLTFSTLRN